MKWFILLIVIFGVALVSTPLMAISIDYLINRVFENPLSLNETAKVLVLAGYVKVFFTNSSSEDTNTGVSAIYIKMFSMVLGYALGFLITLATFAYIDFIW